MTEPIPLDESSAVLTRSEFTLTYAVTGPNVPMPYGSTDIVPETVMLAIRETEDGDLEVWRMEVQGHRAKKDGTAGLLSSTGVFYPSSAYSSKDIPDWLLALCDTAEAQAESYRAPVTDETSDGHHTFAELYTYRMLYNAALFNEWRKWGVYDVHKSTRHHDGEECFGGGWFIVVAQLPTGQISNHYPMSDWYRFRIPERPLAAEWDGHTPAEAAERLRAFIATTPTEDPTP
jgi:hypothetical protein